MNDEEKAVKLFNGVTNVGDDLIEEAEMMQKRKKTTAWRWALVAACLCAVLLGTAGAAVYQARVPRLEPNIDGSGRFDGYMVTGKLSTYPMKRFSNAFLEAGETGTGMVTREFSTFDEVRAYLGESIPCVWAKGWDGDYTVMLYHDERQKIWGSDVMSRSPDDRVTIRLRMLTENYPKMDEQCYGLYGGGPDAVMERLESYQMPNGCVAETFTIDYTAVEGTQFSTCISFFIKDGNMYKVSVDGELADPARLWPEVRAILDSFQ